MALTFTEKFREQAGHKKHVIYEVVHDGSATTILASDIELNYIDYSIIHGKFALSSVADFTFMSDTTGIFATINGALTATTVDIIEAWGY